MAQKISRESLVRFMTKVKLAEADRRHRHDDIPPTRQNPLELLPSTNTAQIARALSDDQAQSLLRHIYMKKTRRGSHELRQCDTVNEMSQIWTYKKPSPQRHSGGRKGTGGRPTGTTVNVTEQFEAICFYLLSSRILDLGICQAIRLGDFFGPYQIDLMRDRVRGGLRAGLSAYVSALQGNLLGTAVKVTLRDARTRRKGKDADHHITSARDGHAACTWVDLQGNVRCSCIGRTVFNLRSRTRSFGQGCCRHARDFYSFFRSAFEMGGQATHSELILRIKVFALRVSANVDQPVPFSCFKDRVFLVPFKTGEDWESLDIGPRWVPIRHNIEKKSLTCAFCDLRSEKICPHIHAWRSHYQASLPGIPFTESGKPGKPAKSANILTEALLENTSKVDPDFRERRTGRSYLPLDPVSCGEAVRFDDSLYQLAKPGAKPGQTDAFVVQAPKLCTKCSAPRSQSSRALFDEGVLSSTHGPVPMRVETFRCSKSDCNHFIYAEGRSQHIVFYSFLTAATHAFMRREIQAVCLSTATITTRFQSYLRNNIEDRFAGLTSEEGMHRTLRSLSNLFALTL